MSVSPLYAIIDLGSNSFHMLIARLVADSVQIVDKVKRKVRLASGLNSENFLNDSSMARGLECLSFFAERLQDIPPQNIKIVATATLRIANNAEIFLTQAKRILGIDVTLLSGLQEAELIYLGVAHTSCCLNQRLVLDIGGASTEIIAGRVFKSLKVSSLDMGCVTFNQNFFADGLLTQQNFTSAIDSAKDLLLPVSEEYISIGWQSVLSGSGTMQALAEIMMHKYLPPIISYPMLLDLKQQLLSCKEINKISIEGLSKERAPVISSGLAILIALFEVFSIKEVQLSSGALREGLLYEMLPDMRKIGIRQRTVDSVAERFHIDRLHALRVCNQAEILFDKFSDIWQLKKDNCFKLLLISGALHEIGLLLEYNNHPHHGAYIIQHADLPGFDQADRQLLSTLIQLQKSEINVELLKNQSATTFQIACYLLTILRLAIILCQRRADEVLPAYTVQVSKMTISLRFPQQWLKNHLLICDELAQENQHLLLLGLSLNIIGDDTQ